MRGALHLRSPRLTEREEPGPDFLLWIMEVLGPTKTIYILNAVGNLWVVIDIPCYFFHDYLSGPKITQDVHGSL